MGMNAKHPSARATKIKQLLYHQYHPIDDYSFTVQVKYGAANLLGENF